MSATEWLVVIAGAGAIAGVNWFFLFAERRDRRPADPQRTSEEE